MRLNDTTIALRTLERWAREHTLPDTAGCEGLPAAAAALDAFADAADGCAALGQYAPIGLLNGLANGYMELYATLMHSSPADPDCTAWQPVVGLFGIGTRTFQKERIVMSPRTLANSGIVIRGAGALVRGIAAAAGQATVAPGRPNPPLFANCTGVTCTATSAAAGELRERFAAEMDAVERIAENCRDAFEKTGESLLVPAHGTLLRRSARTAARGAVAIVEQRGMERVDREGGSMTRLRCAPLVDAIYTAIEVSAGYVATERARIDTMQRETPRAFAASSALLAIVRDLCEASGRCAAGVAGEHRTGDAAD